MARSCFRYVSVLVALILACLGALTAQSVTNQHLLLRNPSLSQDRIAFRYADDIWTASRQGGEAERLTSNGFVEAGPYFSPDGTRIAYSAHLQGNTDVYIVPAAGGVPRRITWHPAGSTVVGWTRDGNNLLISSSALSTGTSSSCISFTPTGRECPSLCLFRPASKAHSRPTDRPLPINLLPNGSRHGSGMQAGRRRRSGL